ncbi:dUTP diphosphatase, partial [Gracilibacillus dipsosauri]|uniref:dUTP diphosphatase n=1 Tax=Gracilibacillus dipsosauri TaxID=178340 RepID=UPI0024093232
LQVELGELANEARFFKFWSNDQEPRTKTYKSKLSPGGEFYRGIYEANPLLEEYVDCLHFILSIGLELKVKMPYIIGDYEAPNVIRQFNFVFEDISKLDRAIRNEYEESMITDIYDETVRGILGLGSLLGFTWEQIETAYLDKNKINHERQRSGY